MNPDLTELLDPAGCIAADTPCRKCGYNVRGLPIDRNCPECGLPASLSAAPDFLTYAEPDWARMQSAAIRNCSRAYIMLEAAAVSILVAGLCGVGLYFVQASAAWLIVGVLVTFLIVGSFGVAGYLLATVTCLLIAFVQFNQLKPASHRFQHRRLLWRSRIGLIVILCIAVANGSYYCATGSIALGIIVGLFALVSLLYLFLPASAAESSAYIAELMGDWRTRQLIRRRGLRLLVAAVVAMIWIGVMSAVVITGSRSPLPPLCVLVVLLCVHSIFASQLLLSIRGMDERVEVAAFSAEARWKSRSKAKPRE
jgi:small-conductance mechanosensitive channel